MDEPAKNDIPLDEIETLREKILTSLVRQGFELNGNSIKPPDDIDKNGIRRLHQEAVQTKIEKARKKLKNKESELLKYIANGNEIEPENVSPRIVQVTSNSEEELLFRYATLHWSIPVSSGYGRRLRFLVLDENNGKLIGLFGLGDPVFSLKARDSWIGWNIEERKKRLKYVMDAFVLGAIPPYSFLLCGKLIAMLLTCKEIQQAFENKYSGKISIISQQKTNGSLALLTTTSALGRSSIYNRIKYDDRNLFDRVGFTSGSGEFHFSNGMYSEVWEFTKKYSPPTAKKDIWGSGYRNRRELVTKCLKITGLPHAYRYHHIKREIFVIPLAENTKEFLCGKDENLKIYNQTAQEIWDYFKKRWLLGRAERNKDYLGFESSTFRLWESQEKNNDNR